MDDVLLFCFLLLTLQIVGLQEHARNILLDAFNIKHTNIIVLISCQDKINWLQLLHLICVLCISLCVCVCVCA